MKTVKIRVSNGFTAQIKTDFEIPKAIHQALMDKYNFVNPLDLRELYPLYDGEGHIFRGYVQEVAKDFKSFGYNAKVVFAKHEKRYEWFSTGKPRGWQKKAVPKFIKRRQGIIQATTGRGKTLFAGFLTAELGTDTLFLCGRGLPFNQAIHAFTAHPDVKFSFADEVKSYRGKKIEFGKVTVATVQSLYAALKRGDKEVIRALKKIKFLIIDECHNVGKGAMYLTVIDHLINVTHVCGITATAFREDGFGWRFKAVFGEIISKNGYDEAIDAEESVPITVYVKKIKEKDYGYSGKRTMRRSEKGAQYQEVYNDYVVSGSTGRNTVIKRMVKAFRKKGLTTAIIVGRVAHAYRLQSIIKGNAEIGTAQTPKSELKELLDKLRHREIDCFITTLFDEAADIPSLDCVILAAAGVKKRALIQRLRNTRACNTKKSDQPFRTGHYVKKRGYVFLPLDQCDFLQTQSTKNVKNLKEIVKVHKKNRWVDLDAK